MADPVKDFNDYRAKMNTKLMDEDSKVLKRLFNLDTITYQENTLDRGTKELLGLVASAVLRCDDCVKYHLENCWKAGLSKQQIIEALEIATVVGGTIVIPHLRRAYEFLEALEST